MNIERLIGITRTLMMPGKGLLAMDESVRTCNRRLAEIPLPPTEESRRRYRELLLTTPGLGDSISGVILFDETLHQQTHAGRPFAEIVREAGMLIGVKVDTGAPRLAGRPGEHVTEGLDGLRDRLRSYAAMSVDFAKWRAVLPIGEGRPSRASLEANGHALARYAALCQEAQLVPIVEPEVLMDGAHSLEHCRAVTLEALHVVFDQLHRQGVLLEGIILKPNMVLPGASYPLPVSTEDIARVTLETLRRAVPAAVAGIAFLSGGQEGVLATVRLNAMHAISPVDAGSSGPPALPWPLTFSFGRALQQAALTAWHGEDALVVTAQQVLNHRARCNSAAVRGLYTQTLEAGALPE